jgi:hypothetical protein
MIQQKDKPIVDLQGLDQMKVVEDQDQWSASGGQFVDQARQEQLNVWQTAPRSLQRGQCTLANARANSLQCSDHIGPELQRVVVPRVKREPGSLQGRIALFGTQTTMRLCHMYPLAQQRGLAKTRRSRDESQFA